MGGTDADEGFGAGFPVERGGGGVLWLVAEALVEVGPSDAVTEGVFQPAAADAELEAVGDRIAGEIDGRRGEGLDLVGDVIAEPGDFDRVVAAEVLLDSEIPAERGLRLEVGISRTVGGAEEIQIGRRAKGAAHAAAKGGAGGFDGVNGADAPGEFIAVGVVIFPTEGGGGR